MIRINGTNAIEIPDNDIFSPVTTGKLTVRIKVKFNKLNEDVAESGNYVNYFGKSDSQNDPGDRKLEWLFRKYQETSRR